MAGEGWRGGRGTHPQNLDLRDGMEDGAEVRGHHPREQRRQQQDLEVAYQTPLLVGKGLKLSHS